MSEAMLARGAKGAAVETLQRALAAMGINPGPIDGLFGPTTEAAVKRFQEKVGLSADGVVGPKTRAALTTKAQGAVAAAESVLKPKQPPAPKEVL
jgi:peptidoglycan hydrolase-like protein with peptidoglycan-binding domain